MPGKKKREKYFADRLRDMLKEYPESVKAIIAEEESQEPFIQKARDFRNYRAHFGRNQSSPHPKELLDLVMNLMTLFEIQLLGEIGFEDQAIKERLANPILKGHPLLR